MGCAPSSPEGSTADADASSLPHAAPTIQSDRYYTRVVFLDVDGVLHTGVNNNARHLFHEHCMANLREIVHGPLADVGIVLSSSWRSTQRQVDEVNKQLKQHSIALLVGVTTLDGFKSRSDEILSWVEAHPRVKSFVALDDMDLSKPHGDRFAQNFVHVDVDVALTKADAERALAILSRPLDRATMPRAARGVNPHPS